MSSPIPPALKPIAPFITKGIQMEKADPVIAYFCYLWAVQLLLSKELHTKGNEEMAYATQLLEKLEKWKADLATNEAVMDDLVGQAYVETFALKIFTNAENTQNARKCTKQTAETFLAAATFLELLRIFGELDTEISKKVIFAKYHANRIIKAIKAGEDTNLPAPEAPEVQISEAPESPSSSTHSKPPRPTVEEADDEAAHLQARMAGISTADESLHPSRRMTPVPGQESTGYEPQSSNLQSDYQPSPISPPAQYGTPSDTQMPDSAYETFPTPPPTEITSSYFPPPPVEYVTASHPNMSENPATNLPQPPSNDLPPTTRELDEYYTSSIQPSQPPPIGAPHYSPPPPATMPQHLPPPINQMPQQQYHLPQTHNIPPQPTVPSLSAPLPPSQYRLIDPERESELVAKAQKHARFAISALNYDDVLTAVKELNDALKTLGAA